MKENLVLRYLLDFGLSFPKAKPFPATRTKCLVFIAFVACIAWTSPSSPVMAQSVSKTFVFESSNKNLDETLKALGTASGFLFTYSMEQVGRYRHVSIAKGNRNIAKTLSLLLENTDLTYRIKGRTILIFTKEASRNISSDKQNRPKDTPGNVVTGAVRDELGNPLLGVTVRIKNTAKAVTTDAEGAYSLEAEEADVLSYSFIGFLPKEQKVTKKTIYNVILSPDSKLLDEVQIIGYGTTTRRLKTSGVATLKGEEIEGQPTSSNFLQALQGKLAGVAINQSGGGVGNSPEIYIRGINSITSGNSPLYVLDGVIISDGNLDNAGLNGMGGLGSHNALSSIDQSDIASIDILKDADATAIYGSRGANGVVLITTRKGKEGKISFTLVANTGFNKPITTKYLGLQQYLTLRREAFNVNGITPDALMAPDLKAWSQTNGVNWTKKLNSNNGSLHNVSGTLTGGSKELSFLASLNYNSRNDTYFSDPNDNHISGKTNINHRSENGKLQVSVNASFSSEQYTCGIGSTSSNSAMMYALPPNFPEKDADGNYTWIAGNWSYRNPYATEKSSNKSSTSDFLAGADISYSIGGGLAAKISASYNCQSNQNTYKLYSVSISPTSIADIPGVTDALTFYKSLNIEPQLTYTQKWGKAKVDVLLGSTWFSKTNECKKLSLTGYESEAFFDSWSAAKNTTKASSFAKYNMRSWFGRLGYNLGNKYIANFTYRADGSSRFGTDNRWGQFSAFGAAWIYSNEPSIKNALPWLSYGKLRTSYGITGNDNIPDYRFRPLYSASDDSYGYSSSLYYDGASALLSTYLPNKSIKWEKTKKLEIAMEDAFLNERISSSVAYFSNRTTDMLLNATIGGQTGFGFMLENLPGIVDNKGWEVEINSSNVETRDFNWKTGFNITFQKNELTRMPARLGRDYSYFYFEGKPIVNFRGYKTAGIDPSNGNIQWVNATTGAIQASPDYTPQYIGSHLPTVFGGLSNKMGYKRFSLDFSISFAKQTMTDALYYSNTPGTAYNLPEIILGKYWQKEGDNARYPKLDATGQNTELPDAFCSNQVFHDGIYFKLQNVALTYGIPARCASIVNAEDVSLYIRGQNLCYLTPGNNLGKDPERIMPGGLSLMRTFTFGFKVKF